MYIKKKYIDAVHSAIDFVSNRVDGADEDKQEDEMLSVLRELRNKMQESRHKQLVGYYVGKGKKKQKN